MNPDPSPESRIHLDLLIGGTSRPAAAGTRRELRSPAHGGIIGSVAEAGEADLHDAVAAADQAFASWSSRTAQDREKLVRQASAFVRTRADGIGRLMALEQGKPWAQARSEVLGACDTLDYYAAEAPRIEGWTNPTEDPGYRSWVTWHPVGVCGLITPWNYPVSLLSWKLGPALATGCTVVVKPTTVTPWSPLAFCAALTEGGLPGGVVNCIPGPGVSLGEALVRHPKVAKIAMTGSTETGKRILSLAAPYLKKVSLELGGQCPAIVAPDADLDLAARTIAYKAFRNCGQSCSAVNRVYVDARVADALVERLRGLAESMSIGDGISDPKVDLGPMTTAEGVATTAAHVADALALGATLVTGGGAPVGGAYSGGHYYRPTVLTGCRPAMRVMREESFGPVVGIATFTGLEEAIARANDTPYGLVSYLFTRDFATTVRVSEALEAGTVCVNHGAVNTHYGPYAGWKDSGYGLELSRRAVFEYLKPKHVKVALG
ncbi:MAG: aldehyde dehydrogenase family protein [Verrucomicrobiales bacterium]|nr:aldehyde dehydrogenase family protein [Verrucomicrobiales bacterium]